MLGVFSCERDDMNQDDDNQQNQLYKVEGAFVAVIEVIQPTMRIYQQKMSRLMLGIIDEGFYYEINI